MSAAQKEISVSEFFAKNRHLLGFDNPRKVLLTTVKEAVDNSLDACEEAGILPEIWVQIEQTGKAIHVMSKISPRKPAHFYVIRMDTKANKPDILNGGGFHQGIKRRFQSGLKVATFLAASTRSSYSFEGKLLLFGQFLETSVDGNTRNPSRPRHKGKTATSQTQRFRRRPQSPLTFIQNSCLHQIFPCYNFFHKMPP